MNLQLRESSIQTLDANAEALDRCRRAKELEMDGDYSGAHGSLGDLCPILGVRPDVSAFQPAVQAEVLLRSGSLCGWLGGVNQVERSQEVAKDLISESRGIFEELNLTERVADASNDLAICYWREGAYDEARATLHHALAQVEHLQANETKCRTLLNLAVIERSSMRLKDALRVNREAAKAFEDCTNHSLLGKFHNEYATVLKNLGLAENREEYIDQALVEYAAAGFHLEQVGNKRFQGVTENNQGLLFASIGRFADAHQHLDRARSLFVSINDKGSVAQTDETRSRVFLWEGKYSDAERLVRGSVRVLQRGDQRSLLAEALTTLGAALARLNRQVEARAALKNAIDISEQVGDPETAGLAALTMVEELESFLGIEAKQFYGRAETLLVKSQDSRLKERLGACARLLLAKDGYSGSTGARDNSEAAEGLGEFNEVTNYSLEERVLRYEGQLIKRALEASGGSVTRAARRLGITHQGLAFILNGRHKNLLTVRTPVKPRRRSIIRHH